MGFLAHNIYQFDTQEEVDKLNHLIVSWKNECFDEYEEMLRRTPEASDQLKETARRVYTRPILPNMPFLMYVAKYGARHIDCENCMGRQPL